MFGFLETGPVEVKIRGDQLVIDAEKGRASFNLTDDVRDQLRKIVRDWDMDEEAAAHEARCATAPKCDHCGQPMESTRVEGGQRWWCHIDGGFRCAIGTRLATFNGSDRVL